MSDCFATSIVDVVDGNCIGRIQVKPNYSQRSVGRAVTAFTLSFFFLAFVSAFHFASYFQLKLQSFWHLMAFFSLFLLVFVLHSISALSTKILINSKVFCMRCLNRHFHFSSAAVHYLSMKNVSFSILHPCSVSGTYTKVHPHRIHFERTNTRRDLFPLFVFCLV